MKKRHRPTTTQQSVVAATAAVAVAVGSISPVHDFTAFAFSPSSSIVRQSVRSSARIPSTTRWNVVTPISTHKQKDNVDEPIPRPTKGRKKSKKQHDPTGTISRNMSLTQSFGAVTYATYKSNGRQVDPDVKPVDIHTLILGTHPGIQSLEKSEYYGHPMK